MAPTESRRCSKCAEVKLLTEFHVSKAEALGRMYRCAVCSREATRAHASKYPDRVKSSQKKSNLCRRYGITSAAVEEMTLLQGGRCKICSNLFKGTKDKAVDHNHATGIVRGLLCTTCNLGLGQFQDNPALLGLAQIYLHQNGHYGSTNT